MCYVFRDCVSLWLRDLGRRREGNREDSREDNDEERRRRTDLESIQEARQNLKPSLPY